MISFLVGIIEEKNDTSVIVNVNGIGYEVNVSSNTLVTLPIGEMVKVLTNLAVREDGISLYGFSTHEEREIFNKLITVSGVGPKVALQILSGLSLSDLCIAIVKEDTKLLSKIKGLGKKTAERICLELKDKISPLSFGDNSDNYQDDYNEDALQMAIDTLVSLGINKNDAYMLARANAGNNATAEEIITKSIRGYQG